MCVGALDNNSHSLALKKRNRYETATQFNSKAAGGRRHLHLTFLPNIHRTVDEHATCRASGGDSSRLPPPRRRRARRAVGDKNSKGKIHRVDGKEEAKEEKLLTAGQQLPQGTSTAPPLAAVPATLRTRKRRPIEEEFRRRTIRVGDLGC